VRAGRDAFTRIRRLREALRQALEGEQRRPVRPQLWQPPMDLIATEDAYVLRLDLPGVSRGDVQASVEGEVVRVQGTRPRARGLEGAEEVRLERAAGAFGRSIRLPGDADSSAVSARLADGVLTIRVGRRQRASSRIRIEIA